MAESTWGAISDRREGPFEVHAVRVMADLRRAFLGVIEGLPGGAARAADLERALGVSRTLGWQIHRIATASDPLEAGLRVPGTAAVRQALRGARSAGVADDRIARANAAMTEFEALVKRHAGDRATFETMIGSLAGGEVEAIDLKTRRQAFRVHSQIWGVQVKTYLSCGVLMPGASSDLMDLAFVCGMRDVRRLRPGVPLPVMGQRITDNCGDRLPPSIGPGEALSESGGPMLLREYCSQPLPELETLVDDGTMTTLLRDAPLGNAGARTVYLASISRGLRWNMPADAPNHHIAFAMISKPMEMLVLDVLVHRNMFGELSPNAKVYGSLDHLGETDPYAFRPDETLPILPSMRAYAPGLGAIGTPHIPRYREMIDAVLARLGWDPEAFDLYRCTLEYPLLSTTVQVRFNLPEHGGW